MFKDAQQQSGVKVMALVLGISFALSSFVAGISPLSPGPFMKAFFFLFLTGAIWWMLVKVFKVESRWGRFWMLPIAGLLALLLVAAVDSTLLDDAHDFPGKEYVDRAIDWVKDVWNKAASSVPSLPVIPTDQDDDEGGVGLPDDPTSTDGEGDVEEAGGYSFVLLILGILAIVLVMVIVARKAIASRRGRPAPPSSPPSEPPSTPPSSPPSSPPPPDEPSRPTPTPDRPIVAETPSTTTAREAVRRAEEPVREYEERAAEIERTGPSKETMWSDEAKEDRKARAKERKKRERKKGRGTRFKANLLGKSKPKKGIFSKLKFWEKDDDEEDRPSFSESRAHFKKLSDPVEMKRVQEFDAFEDNLRRLP